jgi:hypothetical protein
MIKNEKFSAAFAATDRYRPPKAGTRSHVLVDGELCECTVIGENGPRAQVRFLRGTKSFVRWFDADALLP